MYRRRFLVASGVGAVTSISGCLGSNNSGGETDTNPTIEGEGLNLAPGEEATVKAQIDNVGSVQFSRLPDSDSIVLAVNEAGFSESTSGGDDAYPPYWNWYPPDTSVEVSVPVSVGTDAEPGEYRYAVTAWHVEQGPEISRNDAESVTEEYTITVTEE